MTFKNKNYGWVVVAVSAAAMAMIYSVRHTFSVFFPDILNEFGWSRASTVSIYSFTILTYGVTALFSGTLGARYSPKVLMCAGLVFTSAATAACSLANELWHFYLIYGVLAPIGMSFCGWPLLVPAVANWFSQKRGTAISIAQAGSGFSFTMGVVIEPVIAEWGWRIAYIVQGLIILALILPLYLFFFRYRPESRPAGRKLPKLPAKAAKPEVDWTLSGVMHSPNIWLMGLGYFFFWGVGIYLLLAHQVKFAQDVGYSPGFAASIFALFGVMSVVGMFCAGVSDYIGRESTAGAAALLAAAAVGALLLINDTSQPWLMYAYSMGLGLGSGLITPTIFSGAADIYRGRYYGTATGILLVGMGLGGALGPWLGGLIHDLTGSYRNAFGIALVCLILGFLCFCLAAPRKAESIRAKLNNAG